GDVAQQRRQRVIFLLDDLLDGAPRFLHLTQPDTATLAALWLGLRRGADFFLWFGGGLLCCRFRFARFSGWRGLFGYVVLNGALPSDHGQSRWRLCLPAAPDLAEGGVDPPPRPQQCPLADLCRLLLKHCAHLVARIDQRRSRRFDDYQVAQIF